MNQVCIKQATAKPRAIEFEQLVKCDTFVKRNGFCVLEVERIRYLKIGHETHRTHRSGRLKNNGEHRVTARIACAMKES